MLLPIESIRRDGGTQPRTTINLDTAYEYGDEMKAGAAFPPVVVFYDGTDHWLADGFHRVEGAFSVGLEEIECDVRQGTLEDAQWFSFGVNKSHGLRRTNEDKKRAIEAAFRHPFSGGKNDSDIAKHIGCSHSWVSEIRNRIFPERKDSGKREVTRNGVTYQQNTANIGKRPQTPDGGTRVTLDRIPEPAPAPSASRNTARKQTDRELEREAVARDMESVASAVWEILDSESTPGEIAAYIVDSKIDISSWEDARDFLTEAIAKAKRD